MKKAFLILFILFFVFLFNFDNVLAKIGVGVNTGKIYVDEVLKAGQIYKLPSITIINTGDEPSDYEVGVTYHQDQPQFLPDQNWFIFSPGKFYLNPKEAQLVEIKINLPLRIEPGDYFAYLEGRPIKTTQKGTASIGVAAAAQLYFTAEPANIFYAIYYKIKSFFEVYAPWPQRALILIGIISAILLIKKYFNFNISFKKSEKKSISKKKKTDG